MGKKNFSKGNHREKEVKEFDEEVIQIDRVTRVVKGGRRLRFRVLVAIGDRKGRVGIGIGKAAEVVNGIKKAIAQAKKELLRVPLTDMDSIPHEIQTKHKAARIFMMPALHGTGVIAGGSLRKILSLAGVKNVIGKSHGSNNRLVTAQATIKALKKLRPAKRPKKMDADNRGAHLKSAHVSSDHRPMKAESKPVAQHSKAKPETPVAETNKPEKK